MTRVDEEPETEEVETETDDEWDNSSGWNT